MAVLVISVQRLSPTKVRLVTSEMVQDVEYNIRASNIVSTSGYPLAPADDNINFTGEGVGPQLVSATILDSLHLDLTFDEHMNSGSVVLYAGNYALSGASSYAIATATLDADNSIIHLTFAHKILNGAHVITLANLTDAGGNLLQTNPSAENFTYTYIFPLQEIVLLADADYSAGSLIAIDTIGVQYNGTFPTLDLLIDGTVVESFTTEDSSGNPLKYRMIKRKVYTHPGHVTIDQLQVALTNAVAALPNEAPLYGWSLDPLSTVLFTCEKDLNIQLARVTLAGASGDPSELNSISYDLGTVTADLWLTALAKMRAPIGVQGRMELWLSGTLYEAANFNGIGISSNDWIDVTLPAVTPTGSDLDPELRLVVNAPDIAGSAVDWTEVLVNQQMVTNPDFATTLVPWYLNSHSYLSPTLESDIGGTFVRCTVVKAIEPPARYYHNMVYDVARSTSVMFGGTPSSGVYANDLYEFSAAGPTWLLILPSGGVAPSARGRFSFAYDSSRGICILFGGKNATTSNDETWEYNGTTATWVQKASGAVAKPSARYSPAVAFDSVRNVFILFGGYTAAGCDSETWEYAVATATWSLIAPFGGIKPSARYYATMVYDSALGKCILFGGVTTTARDSETWTYDSTTSTWTIVSPIGGIKPSGRSEHSMIYDSDRNVCIVYGGQDGSAYPQVDHYMGDTWEYRGASSTWVRIDAGSGAGVTSPYELVAFAMSYDTSTNKSILFSGVNWSHGGRISQTWTFDSSVIDWTLLDFNPTYGFNVSHLNSLSLTVGTPGSDVRCVARAKCRAPIGVIARIQLYTQPWGSSAVSSYYDFHGTGDWEDVYITPQYTSIDCPELLLRLTTLYPDMNGSYVDWKNVYVEQNLVANSYFRTRSLIIDKIIIDGRGYETTGDDVYSTGTWIPGDGAAIVPGYRESDFLSANGNFDWGGVSDEDIFADVDLRIETYRKGNGIVRVVTAGMSPIPGATVMVEQTKHEFLFGTEVNLWEEFQGTLTPPEQELWDRYQLYVPRIFNYATQPFYWTSMEATEGIYDTATRTAESLWCTANGMSCKGHPLFWHYTEPTWLTSKDLSLVKAKILTYINDQPTLHSARINVWDVVNEISTWEKSGFLESNSPAMTRIWLEEGYIPLLKEIFNTARAAAGPGAVLLANDFYIDDNYYSALKRIDDGAGGYLFDAVGVQTHMHDEVYSNQKLWYMCDRFGSLTGSIHFTETSILSGPAYTSPGVRATTANGITIWDSTPEGEIQQALEVIRYYKLLFSHPYVKAITWWNASDYNSWMDAPHGLLDINMLPKQAYTELDNLINSEWWTTTSGTTDSSGEFAFRGFAGNYDITVSKSGYTPVTQSVVLTTAGDTWNVVLT